MPPTNSHKSFAGSSLYLFAARLFPAIATPLAFILYAHQLPPVVYGHYQNFWIQLLLLAALASAGLPVFVFTYTPAQLRQHYRRVPGAYRIGYVLLVAVSAIAFGLLQYSSNDLNPVLPILFFIVYVPVAICEALLLIARRFRYLLWTNLLFSVLFIGIHYLVLQYGFRLDALIGALILLYLLRSVSAAIATRKAYRGLADSEAAAASDWTAVRRHWWHMGLNDMVQVIFRWIDKFILSLLLAKEVLALYSNATYDIPFLGLFFTAVSSAALLHWSERKQQNTAEQLQVLHYSSRILSSVVLPLFCFLVCFSQEVLTFLYSSKYESGLSIFICAQLILPVRAYPFTSILQNFQRGDLINKGAIADLIIACVLMYPLYRLLGLTGVALSFVISTYLQAGYYLVHSARLLQRSPIQLIPWQNILAKLLLNAILFGSGYFIVSALQLSPGMKLLSGGLLLLLSGGILLRYEWRKGNQFFDK